MSREAAIAEGLNNGVFAFVQTACVAGLGVAAAHRYWPPFAAFSPSIKACMVLMPGLFMFSLRAEQTITDHAVRRR